MYIRKQPGHKKGFTVIEVMLFLAITGLMLLGVLGGTYSAINRQRYNDAVRSYSDFLKGVYAEVISPRSNGQGNSSQAIFGKVIFFDSASDGSAKINRIYTATLVGSKDIPVDSSNFIQELSKVMDDSGAGIYCDAGGSGSVQSYAPIWDSTILRNNNPNDIFTGAIIIARSPVSGTVHTIYSNRNYGDPATNCSAVSAAIKDDLKNQNNFKNETINFCVNMFGINPKQNVRIANDGRNSSAIQTIGESDSSYACH